jgi:hypothetical protein
LMSDICINGIISSGVNTRGLELLEKQSSVGSLSKADEFSSDKIERFWLNSRNIQQSSITESEPFLGEMMRPIFEDVIISDSMLNLLVEYYMATYEILEFQRPFGESHEDSIVIGVKINQFSRCGIGSEIFGSNMSSRHLRNSFILAKFITKDGDTDCFPGQVQFFFIHKVNLPDEELEHSLAFIRWYKHVTSNRYYFSIDNDEVCNVELWDTKFYPEGRDCIVPVHNILSRFVSVKYQISGRKNVKNYLAVNPINRKLNIR